MNRLLKNTIKNFKILKLNKYLVKNSFCEKYSKKLNNNQLIYILNLLFENPSKRILMKEQDRENFSWRFKEFVTKNNIQAPLTQSDLNALLDKMVPA